MPDTQLEDIPQEQLEDTLLEMLEDTLPPLLENTLLEILEDTPLETMEDTLFLQTVSTSLEAAESDTTPDTTKEDTPPLPLNTPPIQSPKLPTSKELLPDDYV